jgi:hypothetical protein
MKRKALILFYSMFVCLGMTCQGQEVGPYYVNLPEYQVDPCLVKFLAAVSASNRPYYDAGKYFYSLTFREAKGYRYMHIRVEKWLEARDTDYVGILKIDSVSFLCRGDFKKDPIFKVLPLQEVKVRLQRDKKDPDNYIYNNEPSLQGSYNECQGIPIHLEVYTKGRIPALERKIHPLKSK